MENDVSHSYRCVQYILVPAGLKIIQFWVYFPFSGKTIKRVLDYIAMIIILHSVMSYKAGSLNVPKIA